LSHLDADHKGKFRPKENLSLADDPSDGIPIAPPLVTALTPDEKEDVDEDEITFNAAWFCAVANSPMDVDEDEITFNAVCNAAWCRGLANAPADVDEDEITFNAACCCAVTNAPTIETKVTNFPLKTQQEMDTKKEVKTNVSGDENANLNAEAEHVPVCFAETGWFLSGVAIVATAINCILFGTPYGTVRPTGASRSKRFESSTKGIGENLEINCDSIVLLHNDLVGHLVLPRRPNSHCNRQKRKKISPLCLDLCCKISI
jgi:hypothetical protein